MFRAAKTILLLSFLLFTINNIVSQTKFAVIGDYGDDNNDELAVANMVKSWNVDFVITTGDNSYGSTHIDVNIGQYYQEFIYPYSGSYGSGSPTEENRFYPSLGNHDYSDGGGISAYLNYFTLPGNEYYYDFIRENVHFFAIDNESSLSSQETWLEDQMSACTSNDLHWKIVYFHKAPYSSGSHGNHPEVQWDFKGMGAHAIFSGHDHNYERRRVDDLVYFVNGSGGKSLRSVGTPISYSEFIYDEQHGAQLVTVDGTELTFEFYSRDGILRDSYTICDDPPSVQPVLTLNASGSSDQDDMCIWIHPTDPSLSTIITSDKSANKLFVYDLSGIVIQTISVPGKPGNIDIRYNFLFYGQQMDIVGYNDRDNEEIVIYKVDPSTRQLSLVNSFDAGNWPEEIYGFCLHLNLNTGKYYAFASGKSGQIRQWEIVDNGDGTIGGVAKRTWINGSSNQTESIVADDETIKLYAANEELGIYKYDAEPNDPDPTGVLIAATGENGLIADVEGITLYYAANGEGYLLVSNQSGGDFNVYDRKEPHNYVTTFDVNNASYTDGIDVVNINLGSSFPQGIFLCHDGSSVVGCDYSDLSLMIDVSYWNPRDYPLPVELVYFTGNLNGNNVELRWRTETELNNYGFDIERTKDNSDWLTIGFVEGHGNSNSPKQYSFIDSDVGLSGNYYYRLKQTDNDGTYEYSPVVSVEVDVPNNFYISQNYPNPFNPETRIDFSVPEKQLVSLRVYNTLGELVKVLVNELREAGSYSVEFDASKLPSGVYVYRLQTIEFVVNKKMTLLK
jgi:myo-inositol-hexaphosphate 3-phosphohydrolase